MDSWTKSASPDVTEPGEPGDLAGNLEVGRLCIVRAMYVLVLEYQSFDYEPARSRLSSDNLGFGSVVSATDSTDAVRRRSLSRQEVAARRRWLQGRCLAYVKIQIYALLSSKDEQLICILISIVRLALYAAVQTTVSVRYEFFSAQFLVVYKAALSSIQS